MVEYTNDAWGKPTSLTGDFATTLGTLNPFRYRGYVYDDEIDFYYLRSRYSHANRGRFINADFVFDGTNLYVYCKNNSINAFDPYGKTAYSFTKMGFGNLMDLADGQSCHRHGVVTFNYSRTLKYHYRVGIGVSKKTEFDWVNIKNQTIAKHVHYSISTASAFVATKIVGSMTALGATMDLKVAATLGVSGFGIVIAGSVLALGEIFATAIEQDIRADGVLGGEHDFDDGQEYIENILSSYIETPLSGRFLKKAPQIVRQGYEFVQNKAIEKIIHAIVK